jgi:hypothetical protein
MHWYLSHDDEPTARQLARHLLQSYGLDVGRAGVDQYLYLLNAAFEGTAFCHAVKSTMFAPCGRDRSLGDASAH